VGRSCAIWEKGSHRLPLQNRARALKHLKKRRTSSLSVVRRPVARPCRRSRRACHFVFDFRPISSQSLLSLALALRVVARLTQPLDPHRVAHRLLVGPLVVLQRWCVVEVQVARVEQPCGLAPAVARRSGTRQPCAAHRHDVQGDHPLGHPPPEGSPCRCVAPAVGAAAARFARMLVGLTAPGLDQLGAPARVGARLEQRAGHSPGPLGAPSRGVRGEHAAVGVTSKGQARARVRQEQLVCHRAAGHWHLVRDVTADRPDDRKATATLIDGLLPSGHGRTWERLSC
jgi:hypothetical protein